MSNQIYPCDLTDSQWEHVRDLFSPAKEKRGRGRPRQLDLRRVVNAILYLLTGGCQWRWLPKDYPAWPSVFYYFAKWQRDGAWQRVHERMRSRARRKAGKHKHPSAGCLDSQSVKATAVPGERGYDSAKKVRGRKNAMSLWTRRACCCRWPSPRPACLRWPEPAWS